MKLINKTLIYPLTILTTLTLVAGASAPETTKEIVAAHNFDLPAGINSLKEKLVAGVNIEVTKDHKIISASLSETLFVAARPKLKSGTVKRELWYNTKCSRVESDISKLKEFESTQSYFQTEISSRKKIIESNEVFIVVMQRECDAHSDYYACEQVKERIQQNNELSSEIAGLEDTFSLVKAEKAESKARLESFSQSYGGKFNVIVSGADAKLISQLKAENPNYDFKALEIKNTKFSMDTEKLKSETGLTLNAVHKVSVKDNQLEVELTIIGACTNEPGILQNEYATNSLIEESGRYTKADSAVSSEKTLIKWSK